MTFDMYFFVQQKKSPKELKDDFIEWENLIYKSIKITVVAFCSLKVKSFY